MLERNKIFEVVDILTPEMFYHEAHKMVYRAISQLYTQRKPFDYMSVCAQLKNNGELESSGGNFFVINLTHGVTGTERIEFWARTIMEKYLQRELIRNSSEII